MGDAFRIPIEGVSRLFDDDDDDDKGFLEWRDHASGVPGIEKNELSES